MPKLSFLPTLVYVMVQVGLASSMWKFDAPALVQEGETFELHCENDVSKHVKIFGALWKKRKYGHIAEFIELGAWMKSRGKLPIWWKNEELDKLNLRGRVDVTEGAGKLVVSIHHATCGDANMYRCESFEERHNDPLWQKTTLRGYRDVNVQLTNGTMCRPLMPFNDSITAPVSWQRMGIRATGSSNRLDVLCVTPPSADVVSVSIYKEIGEGESKKRKELGEWRRDGGAGGASAINYVILQVIEGFCHEDVSYACAVTVGLGKSGGTDTKTKTDRCSSNL